MKKQFLVLGLLVAGASLLAAQNTDGKVRNAVVGLGAKLTQPIEVSLGGFYLYGTQTSSGLSQYLAYHVDANAIDNKNLILVPLSRNVTRVKAGGPAKGIIEGTFIQTGDKVDITLRLIGDPDGTVIDTKQFVLTVAELKELGIDILPANIKTVAEAKAEEEIFTPPTPTPTPSPSPAPTPNTPTNITALVIKAWPDSDTNTYIDGDSLKINLESNKNCYFAVFHVDIDKTTQIIYPMSSSQNNTLQANTVRTIPEAPTRYNIQAPFGQDTIIVLASTQPFTNLQAEFDKALQASRGVVSKGLIQTITRGIGVQNVPGAQAAETANDIFHFTTLPATFYDESYSYKPSNVTEFVQSMKSETLRQNGTFTGNDREGTFTLKDYAGMYRVSGGVITVKQRFTGNKLPQTTRGAGSAHNFTIDKPRNIAQAVQAVKIGIESKGGIFSGNEQQGSFKADGIAGQYNVADKVNVSINEKPPLIPNSLIEKEVRKYFTGK